MTPIDRAAIREALAKATPGPWYVDGMNGYAVYTRAVGGSFDSGEVTYTKKVRDAHLIANAPAWLAELLDALDEAEREAAAGDANWQECEENRLHHFQRADAAERELERWKHNLQVEGDYVCPDSLRADAAESRVKELEASQNTDWRGMALNHSKTIARQISERDAMRRDVGSQADRITALEAQVKVKDEALLDSRRMLVRAYSKLAADNLDVRMEFAAEVEEFVPSRIDAALATTPAPDKAKP